MKARSGSGQGATRAARRIGRSMACGALGAAMLGLAACAVGTGGPPHRDPAGGTQPEAASPGSVYAGWRVYQQRCARCHGADATGGDDGPDLILRLRGIGAPRFVDLVLRRYDWGLPPGATGAPRETLIDDIVKRDKGALQMPQWQGEPAVGAHIMDLYAYLTARAQGDLAPGRPAG